MEGPIGGLYGGPYWRSLWRALLEGPMEGPIGGPYWRTLWRALLECTIGGPYWRALIIIVITHSEAGGDALASMWPFKRANRAQYPLLQKNSLWAPYRAPYGHPLWTQKPKILGFLMVLVQNGSVWIFEPIRYANWDPPDLSGITD